VQQIQNKRRFSVQPQQPGGIDSLVAQSKSVLGNTVAEAHKRGVDVTLVQGGGRASQGGEGELSNNYSE
jgi:hypothetical protein